MRTDRFDDYKAAQLAWRETAKGLHGEAYRAAFLCWYAISKALKANWSDLDRQAERYDHSQRETFAQGQERSYSYCHGSQAA